MSHDLNLGFDFADHHMLVFGLSAIGGGQSTQWAKHTTPGVRADIQFRKAAGWTGTCESRSLWSFLDFQWHCPCSLEVGSSGSDLKPVHLQHVCD